MAPAERVGWSRRIQTSRPTRRVRDPVFGRSVALGDSEAHRRGPLSGVRASEPLPPAGAGVTSRGVRTSAYVHFPWCLKKCPYCDFASAGVRRSEVESERYADAVLRELERRAIRVEEVSVLSPALVEPVADATGRTPVSLGPAAPGA